MVPSLSLAAPNQTSGLEPERSACRWSASVAIFIALAFGYAFIQWLVVQHDADRLSTIAQIHGLVAAHRVIWVPVAARAAACEAMAAVTLMLSRRGSRWWASPALAYFAVPILLTSNHRIPGSVGAWQGPGESPGRMWLGAAIDLAFVTAPSLIGMVLWKTRHAPRSRPTLRDGVALSVCFGVALLVLYDRGLVVGPSLLTDDLASVVAIFLVGAIGRLRQPWDVVLYGLFLITFVTSVPTTVLFGNWPSWSNDITPYLPQGVALLVGLAWPATAKIISRLDNLSTLRLLVLMNLLNVADAIFTRYDIEHVAAVEANPIVSHIGLPAKVIVVAAAGVLLGKYGRPYLKWAVLALGGVIAWHLGGIAVGPR